MCLLAPPRSDPREKLNEAGERYGPDDADLDLFLATEGSRGRAAGAGTVDRAGSRGGASGGGAYELWVEHPEWAGSRVGLRPDPTVPWGTAATGMPGYSPLMRPRTPLLVLLLGVCLACGGAGGGAEPCDEAGATRCRNDRAESCVKHSGFHGPLTWRVMRPTCRGPATCVETARGAMCLAEPVRSCAPLDDAHCDGNGAYSCVSIGGGEYAWQVEDCTSQDRRCAMLGSGLAVCQ